MAALNIPGINLPNVVAAPPNSRIGQAWQRVCLTEMNNLNGLATEADLGDQVIFLGQTLAPHLPQQPGAADGGDPPAWAQSLINQMATIVSFLNLLLLFVLP